MKNEKSFDLREARLKFGKTQAEFAKLLDITPEYLSMIERGVKTMSRKLSDRVALVSETSTGYYTQSPNEEISELKKRIEALETDLAILKRLVLK